MQASDKKQTGSRLDSLFGRLPAEPLPAGFRHRLMEQVQLESARREKRRERRGLYGVIAASIALIGAAAIVCYLLLPEKTALVAFDADWFRLPEIRFPTLQQYAVPLFIGLAVPVLLAFDCVMRRLFHRHQQKTSPNEL